MTRSRSSRGYDDDRYGYPDERRGREPRGRNPYGKPPGGPGGGPSGGNGFQFNVASGAILAGVLVVGIGIGTGISSTTQGDQGNIASSQQLDMAVPDPEFCRQWGASAFVMDIELYTTMNPEYQFRDAACAQARLRDPPGELERAAEARCGDLRADASMQTTHEHLCLHRFGERQADRALRLPNRHQRKQVPHQGRR